MVCGHYGESGAFEEGEVNIIIKLSNDFEMCLGNLF
jgi:hypothetical protein